MSYQVGDTITIKQDVAKCYKDNYGKCPDYNGRCRITSDMLLPGRTFVVTKVLPSTSARSFCAYFIGEALCPGANNYYLEGCLEHQDEDNVI